MRETLDKGLTKYAKTNKNLYLLIADLGKFTSFKNSFPEKHINLGIAESTMVGVAAGLAAEGKQVVIYAVAGFALNRLEQLKLDICLKNKNVKLINAGSGMVYNSVGSGHYLIDDIAILQTLPNMTIATPCDRKEFSQILKFSLKSKEPYYIRLGKDNCEDLHQNTISIGNPVKLTSEESDTILLSYGVCTKECLGAYKILKEQNIKVNAIHLPYLKPLISLKELLKDKKVVVVEDHISFGGLGSILDKQGIKYHHLCLPDKVDKIFHDNKEIWEYYKLDEVSISNYVKDIFVKK